MIFLDGFAQKWSEDEFVKVLEELIEKLGRRFTFVVALHKEFHPCSSVLLSVKSFEVGWLGEEEAAMLLTWHFTGGKEELSDLSDFNQTAMRKLASRCDGIPLVLKLVGLKGYADDKSKSTMKDKIRRFLGCLLSDYSLFQQFCERFDKQDELSRCFKRRWERLPNKLKSCLLCLAIISRSFAEEFAKSRLKLPDSVRAISRLTCWGLVTVTEDQRYVIPRYFRQYLLTLIDCGLKSSKIDSITDLDSKEVLKCVKEAQNLYFEHLKTVMERILKERSSEKMASKPFGKFKDTQSRILDYLHMPDFRLRGKSYDLALDICQSEAARDTLLDYVSVHVLRNFCETCLKSAESFQDDKACFSVFFLQVLLKHQRYRRRDLAKVENRLSVSGMVKKALPKNLLQQRRMARAEFLMAERNYKDAAKKLKKVIQQTKTNFSAQLLLGTAYYYLGGKACAASVDLGKGDVGKAARAYYKSALTCFMNCLRNFTREDDCRRCFVRMRIADTNFRNGEYDKATEFYEQLLEEEENVTWPGEEKLEEFKGRKEIRVSAIHYALGLSQVLQLYVEAKQPIDFESCIASLDWSLAYLNSSVLDAGLLSDCVHLARGKVFLLWALNEWNSSESPSYKAVDFLNAAEESFNNVTSEERQSLFTEKTVFSDITRTCQIESTVLPELGSSLPQMFLSCRDDGCGWKLTPKNCTVSQRLSAFDATLRHKSAAMLLLGNSFLYLDIVDKERNDVLISYKSASYLDSASESDEAAHAESHGEEYSVLPSRIKKTRKSFDNCFLPVPLSATIETGSPISGPCDTRTVASESVSSSVARRNHGSLRPNARSLPDHRDDSSNDHDATPPLMGSTNGLH